MPKSLLAVLLLALAGCGNLPPPELQTPSQLEYSIHSPCAVGGEHSYACQVERYNNVNTPP
ncbi:MAG TPA: hypothetical protein VF522_03470 [Ramlibacter sp.]|uniref:hypothetical protein n=1 Tax=Ramlibacter sp. TaxID=1917967 RepID=UPI002ED375CB